METEIANLAGLLDSHLGPMTDQTRAIPPDKWEWSPAPPVPSPRMIAEHTWHWLVCDRQHIEEPDITHHTLIADAPLEQQALCEKLAAENSTWREILTRLTPDDFAARRFQFGIWPRSVRYIVGHVIQQVIYKHGQLSTLFFWLGLDGEGLYQAPFPNDDYAKIQQAIQHPLQKAVLKGDAASVQRELAKKPDLFLPTVTGYSLLRLAVLHNHALIVTLLLEAGADGNETDADGNSALIAACFTESAMAAKALIAHGVDLHKTNRWNGDALGFARMKNNHELVTLLQQAIAEQRSAKKDTVKGS